MVQLPKTFTVFVLITLLAYSQAWAETVSVAYVQVARLLADPPQVKQVREKLREEFASRDKRLEEQQKQIKNLQNKLEQEAPFMGANEVKRLERDIASRLLRMQHTRKELQQERQMRQNDEVEHLRKIIREVIAQVAQDEKVDLVLESGALWVSPKVDITEKVLGRLNQLAKTGQ